MTRLFVVIYPPLSQPSILALLFLLLLLLPVHSTSLSVFRAPHLQYIVVCGYILTVLSIVHSTWLAQLADRQTDRQTPCGVPTCTPGNVQTIPEDRKQEGGEKKSTARVMCGQHPSSIVACSDRVSWCMCVAGTMASGTCSARSRRKRGGHTHCRLGLL